MNLALTISPFCLISYIAPWIIFKLVGPLPSNLFSWKSERHMVLSLWYCSRKYDLPNFSVTFITMRLCHKKKKDILCKTAEWAAWVPHFALITLKFDKILVLSPPTIDFCMCCNCLTTNKELVHKCRITISSQQLNWPIPPYIVYILENIMNTL